MPFSKSVTCLKPGASGLKGVENTDMQLSATEMREQRRKNREALKTSAEEIEIIKQTTVSDTVQSLRHTNCSQPSSSSKSASGILPDQYHSRQSGSSESVKRATPTLDVGNGELPEIKSVSSLPLHQTRQSNVSDTQREKETQINFPLPHDPKWKEVNEELKVALPIVFPAHRLKNLTTCEISSKLAQWLHTFCIDKFGAKPQNQKLSPTNPHPPKKNKRLEDLRRKKKACRAAHKALTKAGLQDSDEAADLLVKWKNLLRQHNRLRLELAQNRQVRNAELAVKLFRKNPNDFAKNLFKGPSVSEGPTFSAVEAEAFFHKTYQDSDRSHVYEPMDGQPFAELPTSLFNMELPTWKEAHKSVKSKRNGAAPGLDALTYVLFKKCPALLSFLLLLFIKVWRTREIPAAWAIAFTILLAKNVEKLDDPTEFRPITITCTMGKIFFSILSDRLQVYMVDNTYIPREVQKGFLTGVAGCLEHSFAFAEALREAKEEQRQIVACFIDLANAYGSVRHNLIQFALEWYHVPEPVRVLIFNYYEQLMTKVQTKQWSTGFFLFDIGLFQGCVLSTILFDCVFQLLLDFLEQDNKKGYKFKVALVQRLARAYADDLNLTAHNVPDCQHAVDQCALWLLWTVTMKAKPKKCISMAMKKFDPRTQIEKFRPVYDDKIYSPFDPGLLIDGSRMAFILDPGLDPKTLDSWALDKDKQYDAKTFARSHFKFLGRWINFFVKENGVQSMIVNKFETDMETIDKSLVHGIMKAWLYQFYVLARLSWLFLVYDLNHSLAEKLTTLATAKLKKWLKITRSADIGILYRTKQEFGLGLTPVEVHFEKMQIVKCELLKNSVSGDICKLYAARETRHAKAGRMWRYTEHSKVVVSSYNLKKLFPGQVSRQGLGNGNYKAVETAAERRKGISAEASSIAGEKYVKHAHQLKMQKAWIHWSEHTTPFDFSWKSLLFKHSPNLVKFVLHASINWVKTPDLLKIWGLRKECHCLLCGAKQCSLHHIIANCQYSLNNKRYTWRHDSVLRVFHSFLSEHLAEINKKSASTAIPPLYSSFVAAGSSGHKKPLDSKCSLLSGAKDWSLLVDFDSCPIVFPPEIFATNSRPDIIIWSVKLKKVILIELTCPAEEGIANAEARKLLRYSDLVEQIRSLTGWHCTLFTAEVGARGFVAFSSRRCMNALGLKGPVVRRFIVAASEVAAKCSYFIYLSHGEKAWQRDRPLLDPTPTEQQRGIALSRSLALAFSGLLLPVK